MAKPKTKGDPIEVRLPLEIDSAVRARALKRSTTPATVVTDIVENAYRVVTPIDRTAGSTPAILPDDPACTHPKTKVSVRPSGLGRCECGATRGVGGEWR